MKYLIFSLLIGLISCGESLETDVFIERKKEVDILDAIKESERIRNKNFDGELISEGEIPIKKETIKTKKKKKFLIF